MWDLRKRRVVRELGVPGYMIRCALPSPDGSRVACGLERIGDILENVAVVLHVATGKELSRLTIPTSLAWFNDFAFMPPRHKTLAVAARGYAREPVLLWETGRAKCVT